MRRIRKKNSVWFLRFLEGFRQIAHLRPLEEAAAARRKARRKAIAAGKSEACGGGGVDDDRKEGRGGTGVNAGTIVEVNWTRRFSRRSGSKGAIRGIMHKAYQLICRHGELCCGVYVFL